jgi:hypothetical protein
VRPTGFPAGWANPFPRNPVDRSAILVGAGAPPSGAFGPDRSRLDFSNYGAAIDAQGWGREVATSGYGDLQNGGDERLWYTATFAGTSSASPIVVGALACAQGGFSGPQANRCTLRQPLAGNCAGPARPSRREPDLGRLHPSASATVRIFAASSEPRRYGSVGLPCTSTSAATRTWMAPPE